MKIDEKKGLEGKSRKFTAPRENPNEGLTTRCHAILSFCSDCPSLTVNFCFNYIMGSCRVEITIKLIVICGHAWPMKWTDNCQLNIPHT